VFAGSLFLKAIVLPAVAGTGFGLNDAAPTADAMFTVTFGALVPGVVFEGADGDEEPPPQPHMMRTAPATAMADPESNEDRMLYSSK
jgi:hypothetical protein